MYIDYVCEIYVRWFFMNYSPHTIIIIFLIAAGSLFSLTLSFAQLMVKNKRPINYMSACIYFLYGACILCDTTYRPGTEYITPHLLYINYPLLFFFGPVLFFYFRMLVNDHFSFKAGHLSLFIPAAAALLFFTPYYVQPAEIKLALYPLSHSTNHIVRTAFSCFDYSVLGWIFVCFLFSLRFTYYLWNRKTLSHIKEVRIILIYIITWTVLGAVLCYGDVTDNTALYRLCLLCSNILIVTLVYISFRYPDFFSIIRIEASKAKYKNSHIKGIDVSGILERIEELMDYEKIYRDETLTLKKLSELLEIRPHQLSEIINKKFAVTFNSFINNYRVEAAKNMLLDDKKTSILSIAYDCGFNSKNTFNKSFLERTGVTPSEFREKKSHYL